MNKFLSDWFFYFKQLWTNGWWYLMLGLGLTGNAPWTKLIIVAIIAAVVLPALGVLSWRCLRNIDETLKNSPK